MAHSPVRRRLHARRARVRGLRGVGGLDVTSAGNRLPQMKENEMAKRLMWSALLAGIGALSSIVANRLAGIVWQRVFDEEPPE
jgi:hypothetical protein